MVTTPPGALSLTPPRVAVLDPRTGAISREWYRFFHTLRIATQRNQDETALAPDVNALLAAYDAVVNAAIQALQSSLPSPVDLSALESAVQALALTPPSVFDPIAANGFASGTTVNKLTSTQQSTVTTLADVTQLVAPMTAGAVYTVDCFVTFRSAATTTGLNLGFTSPAGSTCQLEVVVPIESTAASSALRITFPNAAATTTGNVLGTGVTAINTDQTARISGIISCGSTAGNFQVRFASEVNASAVTLQIGSSLVMQRIA